MSNCALTLAEQQELMNELREAGVLSSVTGVNFFGDNIQIEVDRACTELLELGEELSDEKREAWKKANCSTTWSGESLYDSKSNYDDRFVPNGWYELIEEIQNRDVECDDCEGKCRADEMEECEDCGIKLRIGCANNPSNHSIFNDVCDNCRDK